MQLSQYRTLAVGQIGQIAVLVIEISVRNLEEMLVFQALGRFLNNSGWNLRSIRIGRKFAPLSVAWFSARIQREGQEPLP
jgi:hypothetical protein